MELKMEKVCVSFPGWSLENFSIMAPHGSFATIVGPSGCGKTTVLRSIAGLDKPDSGKIIFDGLDVTLSPPEDRGVGLVFQEDCLFSHLDVFGNVAFGPSVKRNPAVGKTVQSALSLVGLKGFEYRKVDSLSGGEKKRVAIGRAIASKPRILLLDEPFNGLDGNLRSGMKEMLKNLQQESGLTIVMVTHDLRDALFLASHVVLMRSGRIVQQGPPKQLLSKPKDSFVKSFFSDL